jgi:hypothetical protein
MTFRNNNCRIVIPVGSAYGIKAASHRRHGIPPT